MANQRSRSTPGIAVAGKMNDALLTKCNEIQSLVVEADRQDVGARYRIADLFRQVRDGSEYGDGAMKKLAAYLSLNLSAVYDYAKVVDCWPDKQKFLDAVTDQDKSLSWSHVVELTREEDPDRRQSLMTQALNEGWSVERLAKERKASPVEETDSDTPSSEPATALVGAVEGFQEDLARLQVAWEEELPRRIGKAEPSELPAARDKLSQIRKDLETFYQASAKAIDLCIVRVEEQIKLEAQKETMA
ncbi:MAG: hypothetical protein ACLQNE_06790 [Thermoguttaceae bacterium]